MLAGGAAALAPPVPALDAAALPPTVLVTNDPLLADGPKCVVSLDSSSGMDHDCGANGVICAAITRVGEAEHRKEGRLQLQLQASAVTEFGVSNREQKKGRGRQSHTGHLQNTFSSVRLLFTYLAVHCILQRVDVLRQVRFVVDLPHVGEVVDPLGRDKRAGMRPHLFKEFYSLVVVADANIPMVALLRHKPPTLADTLRRKRTKTKGGGGSRRCEVGSRVHEQEGVSEEKGENSL